MNKSAKSGENHILNAINSLAEHIYDKVDRMPKDELWKTGSKLKIATVDLLFYAAQGLGTVSPAAASFEWAMARKQAVALKTMYRFAGQQDFIELEPEIMLRLDKLVEQIDTELAQAAAAAKTQEEKDLRPWLRKYEIWKKISAEKHDA